MIAEAWVRRLADEFWAAAGGPEPFPRDLEGPTLWALPLAVIKLPRLGLAAIRAHLSRYQKVSGGFGDTPNPTRTGSALPGPSRNECELSSTYREQNRLASHPALLQPDRSLHGCLVVHGGEGIVFLDGSDPPAERRLSLAHEVGHFLADYRAPRARVAERLGPAALAALDNRRPPDPRERLAAALLGVSLAPHIHLLDRGPTSDLHQAMIYGAERRAHQLALELLAPAETVAARLAAVGRPSGGQRLAMALAELLVGEFGLPAAVARCYARDLAGPHGEPSAREWLGLG